MRTVSRKWDWINAARETIRRYEAFIEVMDEDNLSQIDYLQMNLHNRPCGTA